MFYLTTHSTHSIYGLTRCCHIGYSYRLTARVLLYAPSHRQDNTYHGLYYTSRGALAGRRNSSMGPPHVGSIQRPIAPWANTLPLSYVRSIAKLLLDIFYDLRPAQSGTCAAETLRRLTLAYILVECLNEYVIPVRMAVMSRLLNTHKPL